MRHDPAAGAIVIMLRSLKMYGMLAIERLHLDIRMNVDELSEKVNDELPREPIRISWSDPSYYHLLQAA